MSKTETPTEKDQQNGVTRPRPNTITGRVWEIADEISNANAAPAERGAVMAQGLEEGIHRATISTQLGRWRKYHGLVVPRETKPTETEAAEESAA